jgi:hypothetical protein
MNQFMAEIMASLQKAQEAKQSAGSKLVTGTS